MTSSGEGVKRGAAGGAGGGGAKYWMLFFAIAFCWLIFPPLVIRRALKHHPDRLMRNLLQGV